MAIKLKELGIKNIIILEKESNLGGTWFNNTYPGIKL
jgi:cation diffusion facilitator CzcD-associated flavoprotein CzcO